MWFVYVPRVVLSNSGGAFLLSIKVSLIFSKENRDLLKWTIIDNIDVGIWVTNKRSS